MEYFSMKHENGNCVLNMKLGKIVLNMKMGSVVSKIVLN